MQDLQWLGARNDDGFYYLSEPRRFAHNEEEYDVYHAVNSANLGEGGGVLSIARELKGDTSGPALEIGCGTGALSMGLVHNSPYPLTVVSDPSPQFLAIARRKIEASRAADAQLAYAVLMGDELERLPRDHFSLIAMRATLHHIADWKLFIAKAAAALRPGGILAFQEPCAEAFILMGAIAQFLPKLTNLSPAQAESVDIFVGAMSFYSRQDLDKSSVEDKHSFRVDEVAEVAGENGLSMRFTGNAEFGSFRHEPQTFTMLFRNYLKFCCAWKEDEMLVHFDTYLKPYCAFVDTASLGGRGPSQYGTFFCQKFGQRGGTGR